MDEGQDLGYLIALADDNLAPGRPISLCRYVETAYDRCINEADRRRCAVWVMAVVDGNRLREEYFYDGRTGAAGNW